MHKRGGVERVIGPFLGHIRRGQLAQLVVNQRQELCRGVWVAMLNRIQEASDLVHEANDIRRDARRQTL
jgi:hypothetical protein